MHIELNYTVSKRIKTIILIALATTLMGAVFFITLLSLNSRNQATQGVSIANISISKLPKDEARVLLENAVEKYENELLTIKTQNGSEITAIVKEIGITFNIDATLNNAYSYGSNNDLFKKLYEQTLALLLGVEKEIQISIDEYTLVNFINNTLYPIHQPAENASFSYNKKENGFDLIPAKTGKIINIINFYTKLIENAEHLSIQPIEVTQYTDKPLITTNEVADAKENAQAILDASPYTIKTLDGNWKIEKEDIVSWIQFKPELSSESNKYYLTAGISKKEIQDYLTRFSPGLNIAPINAEFVIENNKVVLFSLSEPGYSLDIALSSAVIKENLKNKIGESELIFNKIEPTITGDSINNLGINYLLGKGETSFAGSPRARVHNINIGSDKYNGILIEPGEIFSFNENLGPVTAAEGYLPELVIKRGKTIPEYGGGLCQVSTTMFRAVMYAGLQIIDRYNHSYAVSYYGTPGFDATIYPPNPDLKFKNNTQGTILIQSRVEGTKLIFEIYGKDDGRRVEIDGPHTYDKKANGAVKAWLKRTVYNESGSIMLEKTFYSNYKSPNLYPINRNPFE